MEMGNLPIMLIKVAFTVGAQSALVVHRLLKQSG
jgi:hypothetical protein